MVWVHRATSLRDTVGASLPEAAGRVVVTLDDKLDAAETAGLRSATDVRGRAQMPPS
ncbi:hypothetical protein ACFWU3_21735 [Streptomyces sp. NPDC058685]|uniref:hypothetical protein n=1 Tax=Streptomyces sp. NPDC058685 TaxID=3346598 RepID=UPI0036537E91